MCVCGNKKSKNHKKLHGTACAKHATNVDVGEKNPDRTNLSGSCSVFEVSWVAFYFVLWYEKFLISFILLLLPPSLLALLCAAHYRIAYRSSLRSCFSCLYLWVCLCLCLWICAGRITIVEACSWFLHCFFNAAVYFLTYSPSSLIFLIFSPLKSSHFNHARLLI